MNNELEIPKLDDSALLALTPLPYSAESAEDVNNDAILDMILRNQQVLNENIGQVMSTMNRTMLLVNGVSSEIAPLVESLSKSPILKMFGGK